MRIGHCTLQDASLQLGDNGLDNFSVLISKFDIYPAAMANVVLEMGVSQRDKLAGELQVPCMQPASFILKALNLPRINRPGQRASCRWSLWSIPRRSKHNICTGNVVLLTGGRLSKMLIFFVVILQNDSRARSDRKATIRRGTDTISCGKASAW